VVYISFSFSFSLPVQLVALRTLFDFILLYGPKRMGDEDSISKKVFITPLSLYPFNIPNRGEKARCSNFFPLSQV